VYIFSSSTETAPPEALYRVRVCADGSCRRSISRITRGAQVEQDWCILCVFFGGGAIYCLVYLVVRHDYENIKVRYHNILWQFCTIYCSRVYFHTEVSR
jgi:hypothetical protein